QIADEADATPKQIALAWLLQRSPNILLIPGTSSVAHLRENLAAAEVLLSPEQMNRLNTLSASGGHG
ncbi:MAG: aldo/keto reductase, partial [Enterobacteriaceae bacterium]